MIVAEIHFGRSEEWKKIKPTGGGRSYAQPKVFRYLTGFKDFHLRRSKVRKFINVCSILAVVSMLFVLSACENPSGGGSSSRGVLGQVTGVLYDTVTFKPVEGVTVKAGSKTVKTDKNGYFLLKDVGVGTETIAFNKDGYRFTTRTITVDANLYKTTDPFMDVDALEKQLEVLQEYYAKTKYPEYGGEGGSSYLAAAVDPTWTYQDGVWINGDGASVTVKNENGTFKVQEISLEYTYKVNIPLHTIGVVPLNGAITGIVNLVKAQYPATNLIWEDLITPINTGIDLWFVDETANVKDIGAQLDVLAYTGAGSNIPTGLTGAAGVYGPFKTIAGGKFQATGLPAGVPLKVIFNGFTKDTYFYKYGALTFVAGAPAVPGSSPGGWLDHDNNTSTPQQWGTGDTDDNGIINGAETFTPGTPPVPATPDSWTVVSNVRQWDGADFSDGVTFIANSFADTKVQGYTEIGELYLFAEGKFALITGFKAGTIEEPLQPTDTIEITFSEPMNPVGFTVGNTTGYFDWTLAAGLVQTGVTSNEVPLTNYTGFSGGEIIRFNGIGQEYEVLSIDLGNYITLDEIVTVNAGDTIEIKGAWHDGVATPFSNVKTSIAGLTGITGVADLIVKEWNSDYTTVTLGPNPLVLPSLLPLSVNGNSPIGLVTINGSTATGNPLWNGNVVNIFTVEGLKLVSVDVAPDGIPARAVTTSAAAIKLTFNKPITKGSTFRWNDTQSYWNYADGDESVVYVYTDVLNRNTTVSPDNVFALSLAKDLYYFAISAENSNDIDNNNGNSVETFRKLVQSEKQLILKETNLYTNGTFAVGTTNLTGSITISFEEDLPEDSRVTVYLVRQRTDANRRNAPSTTGDAPYAAYDASRNSIRFSQTTAGNTITITPYTRLYYGTTYYLDVKVQTKEGYWIFNSNDDNNNLAQYACLTQPDNVNVQVINGRVNNPYPFSATDYWTIRFQTETDPEWWNEVRPISYNPDQTDADESNWDWFGNNASSSQYIIATGNTVDLSIPVKSISGINIPQGVKSGVEYYIAFAGITDPATGTSSSRIIANDLAFTSSNSAYSISVRVVEGSNNVLGFTVSNGSATTPQNDTITFTLTPALSTETEAKINTTSGGLVITINGFRP